MKRTAWRSIVIPVLTLGIVVGAAAGPASAVPPVPGPATATLSYAPTGFSSGYLSLTKFDWSTVANATSYNLVTSDFAGAVDQQPGFELWQTLGPYADVRVVANLSGGGTSTETLFTLPTNGTWVPMARLLFGVNNATLTSASSSFESIYSQMLSTFRAECGGRGIVDFKVVGATNQGGSPTKRTALAMARASAVAQIITNAIPGASITTSTAVSNLPAPTESQMLALNRNVTVSFKLLPIVGGGRQGELRSAC